MASPLTRPEGPGADAVLPDAGAVRTAGDAVLPAADGALSAPSADSPLALSGAAATSAELAPELAPTSPPVSPVPTVPARRPVRLRRPAPPAVEPDRRPRGTARTRALRALVEERRFASVLAGMKHEAFPGTLGGRTALRLVFAAPFVAIAILLEVVGVPAGISANSLLVARAATVDWTGAGAAWIGDLYPPITGVIAAVTPGGAFGLSLVGALCAGIVVHAMVELMVQRGFHPSTVTALTLALVANPLFFFMATENLPAFLGIALFGLAMTDVVRFVTYRNTQSGFRAGILLMLATLTDPNGLLYATAAVLTVPFLTHGRHQVGVHRAHALVLVFPTLSALAALMFVQWSFGGDPLGAFRSALDYDPSRWLIFDALFTTPFGLLLLAPVASGWLMSAVVRRPAGGIIATLLLASVLLGFVIGTIPENSAGNTFLLVTLAAIALVPPSTALPRIALANVMALLQLAIAIAAALQRDVVVAWLATVLRSIGLV